MNGAAEHDTISKKGTIKKFQLSYLYIYGLYFTILSILCETLRIINI